MFILTGCEDGADVATPLGSCDRLQPDAVLRGAGELRHAVGGRCGAQHHFLNPRKHRKTRLQM